MKKFFAITALALCASTVAFAASTGSSNVQQITLNATMQEYLRINAPSAAVVNFNVDPMSMVATLGDVKPTFNTDYSVKGGTTVTVYAYLGGDLVGPTGSKIAMKNILGQPMSTGSYVAPAAVFGGTGWTITSKLIPVGGFGGSFAGTINGSIGLEILDHVGGEPGSYTGTLNIVAQAL